MECGLCCAVLCWRHLQPLPAPLATASSQLLQTFQGCPSHLLFQREFLAGLGTVAVPSREERGQSLRREGAEGLKLRGDGVEGLQTER